MTYHACDMCGKKLNSNCYVFLRLVSYCDVEAFENIIELLNGNRSFELCVGCARRTAKLIKTNYKRYEDDEMEEYI